MRIESGMRTLRFEIGNEHVLARETLNDLHSMREVDQGRRNHRDDLRSPLSSHVLLQGCEGRLFPAFIDKNHGSTYGKNQRRPDLGGTKIMYYIQTKQHRLLVHVSKENEELMTQYNWHIRCGYAARNRLVSDTDETYFRPKEM